MNPTKLLSFETYAKFNKESRKSVLFIFLKICHKCLLCAMPNYDFGYWLYYEMDVLQQIRILQYQLTNSRDFVYDRQEKEAYIRAKYVERKFVEKQPASVSPLESGTKVLPPSHEEKRHSVPEKSLLAGEQGAASQKGIYTLLSSAILHVFFLK